MEVSGQLETPAALPPGKEPPAPSGQEARRSPERVWTLWRQESGWFQSRYGSGGE